MEEEIIEFLTEKLSLSRKTVQGDTVLTDMGVDSMKLLSLLLELENKFGVRVSDRDVETFVTVGDIARMIEEKKAGRK